MSAFWDEQRSGRAGTEGADRWLIMLGTMISEGHVVLLHAFPLNAVMWGPQRRSAPSEWQVVTPDLPGFGASAEPPAPSMDAMAQSVLHAMDGLGIERAVIGGLSMGGYVTLALYRIAPERFEGMILADTRATADSEAQKDGRRKMLQTVGSKGSAGVADEMLPKLLAPMSRHNNPELEASVRGMIESSSSEAIGAAVQAMMDRADSTSLLASISVPALVLCGAEDGLTPPSDAQALTAGIPGARLTLLPGAGHLSNLEAPEPFSRAVQDFLVTLR